MDIASIYGLFFDSHKVFSFLAFAFSFADYVAYIGCLARNKDIRPTISSWISWFVMDAAILAGIIAAGETAWQIAACTVGAFCVIATILLKRTFTMNWTKLDFFCFGTVLFSAIVWIVSGNPNFGIVINVMAVTIGTIPMYRNLLKDPSIEPLLPWALVSIGGIFGILAIESWNLAAALAPVCFLSLQLAAVSMICRKFVRKNA